MSLITTILLLLVGARLLGELMVRFGQPAIVGEILTGVLLGPALFKLVEPTRQLEGISDLSMFLIVFSAGLEMEFGEVLSAFKGKGLFVAVCGFVVPFLCGLVLGPVFHLDSMRTVFLALCISVTALPVAVRILESFAILNSTIARYAIATAILNDIAALLCLGVILEMPIGKGVSISALRVFGSVLLTAGKLALFAGLVFIVNRLLSLGGKRTGYIERFLRRMMVFFGNESLFGIAVLFVLLFATISERLGSHTVIGTFFAALMLSSDVFGSKLFHQLKNTLNSITAGFLAPIFFTFLGLEFTLGTFKAPLFVSTVILVSILSKIAAGWLSARWVGLSEEDSLGIGIVLNGRGVMELVVANIALEKHFIGQDLFSTLVLMGIVTTILTPLLFRKFVLAKLQPATSTV